MILYCGSHRPFGLSGQTVGLNEDLREKCNDFKKGAACHV